MEYLVGALAGLAATALKVWADYRKHKSVAVSDLGKAAWLLLLGAEGISPDKSTTLKKWRGVAEGLASMRGVKLGSHQWGSLLEAAEQRWQAYNRLEWDTAMLALLEAANSLEAWAEIDEVSRMSERPNGERSKRLSWPPSPGVRRRRAKAK